MGDSSTDAVELTLQKTQQYELTVLETERQWFKINLTSGTSYTFTLNAGTSSPSMTDTYLELWGPSDEGAPIGGDEGALIEINDDANGLYSEITYTPTNSGTFYLVSTSQYSTGFYTIRATETSKKDLPDIPDNVELPSSENINALELGASTNDNITTSGEDKWYSLSLNSGTSYRILLEPPTNAIPIADTVLTLYDNNGNYLDLNDDIDSNGGNYYSKIIYTPTSNEIFYIKVNGYDNFTGSYKITVDEESDSLSDPETIDISNYTDEVLDQSNTTPTSGAGGTSQWQSFTASKSGLLSKIEWNMSCPVIDSVSGEPIQFQIFAWEGINGKLLTKSQEMYNEDGSINENTLRSPAYKDANGSYVGYQWVSFTLSDNLYVGEGGKYTIQLTTPTIDVGWLEYSTDNSYIGGRANNDENLDYLFRTYMKVDTTAPIITLNGQNPATVEKGTTYTDAGASADGGEDVTSSSTVDTSTIGTYIVTYSATDTAGNIAIAKTRTVNVVDTIGPVITITGDNPVTVELGTIYTDAGATADETAIGDEPIITSGTVDINTVGIYTISYRATDGTNTGSATRTVNVVDTTAPVISVTGDNPYIINQLGTTYIELGATTNAGTVTTTGTVDTNKVGIYTITYSATDLVGNTGTATRTIEVRDTIQKPSTTRMTTSSISRTRLQSMAFTKRGNIPKDQQLGQNADNSSSAYIQRIKATTNITLKYDS